MHEANLGSGWIRTRGLIQTRHSYLLLHGVNMDPRVDTDLTQPHVVIFMCMLFMVFWGNSLSFVLISYVFDFRYFRYKREGSDVMAQHSLPLHVFTIMISFTLIFWIVYILDDFEACDVWD